MSQKPTLHVDLLVIGWGKGGKTLAATLGSKGQRVAVIEQAEDMHGGTCINIGCVPTKTLLHDAHQTRTTRTTASANETATADTNAPAWASAVTRRDTLISKLRAVNHQMLADIPSITLITGHARFTGHKTVEVTGGPEHLSVSANNVVINTGAVPVMPNIPGADSPIVHDSTTIQHVNPLPHNLVIVGAGPIGLEFATMFAGFGSHVTILNRDAAILTREEPEIAATAAQILADSGVDIINNATTKRITNEAVEYALLGEEETTHTTPADAVLFAIGRTPATQDLGLETAGITTTERGAVQVDAYCRTSAQGVYAVGDVTGDQQQTYLSLDDFRIVLGQLTGGGDGARSREDRTVVPTTIFLDPPLSAVGMTEQQARLGGHNVVTALQEVAKVKAMPRPKAVADPRGLIKFVVDADTGLILGARLFHVDSQEVINLVSLAMRAGITAENLRNGIWTHPSSTEALNETLGLLK